MRSGNNMLVVVMTDHHRVRGQPLGFWLCYLLLSSLHLPCGTSVSFSFDFSQPGGYNPANFSLQGDAYFSSQVLELTRNDRSAGDNDSVGRASYAQPVAIWDEATGELASFTTTFAFCIVLDQIKNSTSGDGMAFFLAHYPSSIPSLSVGGNLGLFSRSQLPGTNATGDDRATAIEFDTFLNKQYDTSGNHMGIDLNSLISSKYVNTTTPGSTLTSGLVMTCRVAYDNSTRLLTTDLQVGGDAYHVEIVADLRELLPSVVAVGFSAATGAADELHRVLSWSFDSTMDLPPSPSPPAPSHHQHAGIFSMPKWAVVVIIIIVGLLFVVFVPVVSLLLYFKCWKPRRTTKKPPADDEKKTDDKEDDTPNDRPQQAEEEERPDEEAAVELVLPHFPKAFSYEELVKATENFAQERQVGKGGFATVYKGKLTNPTARWVAIKRFDFELQEGLKREKSFDDEMKAISQGKHINLVDFLGWCKDGNNLMLVYEFVPGGNLDEHLHEGNSGLSWSRRFKIITELAQALHYLHKECPTYCVVHGDLKPANILLDSNYAVKLSDFGLARLIEHGIGSKKTDCVIGSWGYLDPELVQSKERSCKSDVYSFGIVLLEIVSGQKPTADADPQTNKVTVTQLLIDVHNAYRRGTILDAADSKLRAESTSDGHTQMERVLQVGLWCALLDPSKRPDITEARNALQSRDVQIPHLSLQLEPGQ